MIDYYAFNTGNGQRGAIALEEAELPYRFNFVNLVKGEQKSPDFLALNPRGMIPVLVDPDGPDGQTVTLTQSFSIAHYIAQKSGWLLPEDPLSLAQCMEWCSFILTDVSAASMQSFYLRVISKEKHPEAAKVLKARALNFLKFADQRLNEVAYFAGNDYSLADIIAYPTVLAQKDNPVMDSYPHLTRWMSSVGDRPAVQKALEVLAAQP